MILVLIVPAIAEISIGSTRDEVINVYGAPSGQLKCNDEEILTYPGGLITIQDGKVSYIDDDFSSRLENRKQSEQFKLEQEKKGFVLYQGKWITKQEQAEIENHAMVKQAKKQMNVQPILIFSAGGQQIDLKSVLVPGKITIVDFYADWCGPCRAISPYLEQIAKSDAAVFLRKIDIVKWGTPVTQQHQINSVPNIRVFSRTGKMIGSPTPDLNKIKKYIQQAK